MMKEDEWKGCYESGHKWAKLATTDSNSHPAKMSWGLLEHILRHLMKEGILHFGDTVLDPMSGTGRTALAWLAMDPVNNKAITVELEDKFVEMQIMNKVNAERILKRTLNWTILKGDARALSTLLKENNLIGLTSPPYGDVILTGDRNFQSRFQMDRPQAKVNPQEGYSPDPKNIGNCPDKPIVVVSPPYANRFDAGNEEQRKKEGTMQNEFDVGGYSDNPDNIGNLKDKPVVVTSPPYADAINGGEGPNIPAFFQWAKEQCGGQWPIPKKRMRELSNEWQRNHEGYSLDEKNIGNAKDRPPVILTSPPYPTQSGGTAPSETGPLSDPALLERQAAGNRAAKGYGDDKNNLGNLKDEEKKSEETYLDAMNAVYAECAKVCRALVTVTKNPTRNHALRRLDLDTKRLLEANGFKILGWYRARLFYLYQQTNLDGEEGKQLVRGRMSFFKRIQLDKGSPVAEHEDVLVGLLER
jgi:hypothetical protein